MQFITSSNKNKLAYVHFVIKIFLTENECKTLIGFFYQKYFYNKMGLRPFYFRVKIYCIEL